MMQILLVTLLLVVGRVSCTSILIVNGEEENGPAPCSMICSGTTGTLCFSIIKYICTVRCKCKLLVGAAGGPTSLDGPAPPPPPGSIYPQIPLGRNTSDWKTLPFTPPRGLYLIVDISKCGFVKTPSIVTSLEGHVNMLVSATWCPYMGMSTCWLLPRGALIWAHYVAVSASIHKVFLARTFHPLLHRVSTGYTTSTTPPPLSSWCSSSPRTPPTTLLPGLGSTSGMWTGSPLGSSVINTGFFSVL